MDLVERIEKSGELLCLVIRPHQGPEKTTFVTPDEHNLQVGFVVYPGGADVPRHIHLPLERQVTGTSEVVLVKSGHCLVHIYDAAREQVAERELRAGDIVVFISGGHGFRMIEDTVLMEVKQGPYYGEDEKVHF